MANGSLHSLYAVKEAVYGQTPASPALDTVRTTGVTLALTKESLQSAEIRSDRQIADFRMGANQVGGDIQTELSCKTFDQLMQAALLSTPWATASGITPAAEEIKGGIERQSFTFIRKFGDLEVGSKAYQIFTGCEISAFQMTVSANAIVTASFTVFGQGMTPEEDLASLGTPTFLPVRTTAPLDSFTGLIKEGGNTVAVVTEVSINLQNGIESRFVVGKKDSIRPSLGRSNLTGQITAYFDNTTLFEKFSNEEASTLEFTLPDAAGNKLTFILPRVKYTGAPPNVSGEGPVTLTMPFQATLDPVTGTNIIVRRNK